MFDDVRIHIILAGETNIRLVRLPLDMAPRRAKKRYNLRQHALPGFIPPLASKASEDRPTPPRRPNRKQAILMAMENRVRDIFDLINRLERWRQEYRTLDQEMQKKGFHILPGDFLAHTRGSGMDPSMSAREREVKFQERQLKGKLEGHNFSKVRIKKLLSQPHPLAQYNLAIEKEKKQFRRDPKQRELLEKWDRQMILRFIPTEERNSRLHVLMKAYKMGLIDE
jgi:hypothetical protein